MEGVRVALLYTETERGTKVSFRSKGDDHVHLWAQALRGGGHRNASGAFVRKPLEETMRLVIEKAPKFIEIEETSGTGNDDIGDEDAAYLTSLIDAQSKGSTG